MYPRVAVISHKHKVRYLNPTICMKPWGKDDRAVLAIKEVVFQLSGSAAALPMQVYCYPP